MPKFAYTARDRQGATSSATLEAPSRRDALRLLAARGLTPLRLDESSAAAKAPARKPGSAKSASAQPVSEPPVAASAVKLRSRERLPFLQALHDLTSSGLSAGEAVRLLSVRLKEPALRALCGGLWERLSEGAPLSRAMAAYPHVFDASSVNLIAAAEATGSINSTLGRLIEHLTEVRELRRQLLNAMAYPLFMMCVAGGVIILFLTYLLPKLQVLFTSLGGRLPFSTQLLIGASDLALHYGIFLVIGAVSFLASAWRWRASEAGRATSDAWLLRLPVVGSFVTAQTVLAISQTLSVLLENGITTVEALKMTERQIDNRVHRAAFADAIDRVMEGESLSLALGHTGCFPDLVIDRLTVGENTGNIVPSLKDIARNYQARVSQQLQGMTRVFASAMLLAVFVFVGFLAFAIFSAVLQLSASFKL